MGMDYSRYFWQGDRVRLRPWMPDDWEVIYQESFDSPSRQVLQLGTELPKSPDEIKQTIAKYGGCKDVDGVILFTIESLSGEVVGGLSLHSRSEKNGTFGFGVVVYRAHRNRGYAEDAVRILLQYCFHERRYQKCNSAYVGGNEPSRRLHEKLGFIEEGRRRRSLYLNGRFCDDILVGLTREEFDALDQTPGAD